MIKAVLFDLDGTLVNSLFDLGASTNYALEKMGFPTHETEKFKIFVGDGMAKLIERALPEDKRDRETINTTLQIFMEHYRAHYVDNTVPYDGILELLDRLTGVKKAVISNKADEMVIPLTKKLLGDRFDIVCGKREGYPTKPDPTLTLEIIEKLGVAPKECIFVGDSGMDMAVAKNSGCVAVGVLWGFRGKEELKANGADYIVSNALEILHILKELNYEV